MHKNWVPMTPRLTTTYVVLAKVDRLDVGVLRDAGPWKPMILSMDLWVHGSQACRIGILQSLRTMTSEYAVPEGSLVARDVTAVFDWFVVGICAVPLDGALITSKKGMVRCLGPAPVVGVELRTRVDCQLRLPLPYRVNTRLRRLFGNICMTSIRPCPPVDGDSTSSMKGRKMKDYARARGDRDLRRRRVFYKLGRLDT